MNRTRYYIRTILLMLLLVCGGMGSEAWADPSAPTGLSVDEYTTSAILSWTNGGSETAWQICLNKDETNLINADSNPFTLTGLSPNTEYKVKVRAVVSEAYSTWTEEVTFTTKTKVDVTYHVITLPFINKSTNDIAYRIEAIKKTVTCNTEDIIKLPSDLKSPLMKYEAYSYYSDVTKSELTRIFPQNPSTFYTYDFTGKSPLASDAKVKVLGTGDKEDVYVIYDWADETKREDYAKKLDLTGKKTYNIEFKNSTKSWFYALNMNPERGNRGQAVPSDFLYDWADLCADEGVTVKKNVQNRNIFYFKWKLTNDDPYNIILQTAYQGDFIYKEDGYWKQNKGAVFYGSLSGSNAIRTNWMTAEVNTAWTSKSKLNPVERIGWYRAAPSTNLADDGRAGKDNGVSDHLYFSFTLLHRTTAESDYTLAVSWVNVNGDDWVPNGSGQYLLMQHDPEGLPYAGPKFLDFTATDQIRFHEVRDYTFKVKTPFYANATTDQEKNEHTLLTTMKWSDYARTTTLLSCVPDALKRKYTTITGAETYQYKDAALVLASASTFDDAIKNYEDDYFKDKHEEKGVVWLNYTTTSMPFEATGTASPVFTDLKWYNIYLNKEEQYTTWYDTDDGNKFNTKEGTSGHTKYRHESHFAFIGDPYELYVVNRKASEVDPANPNINYLKLNAPVTSTLISGTRDTYKYRAVPNGTVLTVGKTYYTSSAGADEFVYPGEKANGTNFYEKKYRFNAVADGTVLTKDNRYYTSDKGDGTFISVGTEVVDVANDKKYYVCEIYYDPVPNGTILTIGNTYYTSSVGGGEFVAALRVAKGTDVFEKKFESIWEIIYDNNSGDFAGCFRLRQFNTSDSPVTIGWGASDNRPLNGDGGNGSDISKVARLSTIELPMMYYTYYIVDNASRIAIKATEEQIVGTVPSFEAIPEIIRSPFLKDATLTFKTFKEKEFLDAAISSGIISNFDDGEKLQKTDYTNNLEGTANEYLNHIFVKYSDIPPDDIKKIDGSLEYNVELYDKFIYYHQDGETETIKSTGDITSHAISPGYLWKLSGGDPYAMTISINAGTTENVITRYVRVDNWANGTITWVPDAAQATPFIIKSNGSSTTVTKMFEVMATTGVGSNASDAGVGVDASVTYYNIGRSEDDIVKVYSNAKYEHTYNQLRFQLSLSSACDVTYHLIDKYNKDLLQVKGRHGNGDDPRFPATYWSPLVKEYYYYKESDFTYNSTDKTYTLRVGEDGINQNESTVETIEVTTSGSANVANPTDIYVLYTVNDLVDLNHTTMYLLKYAMGDQFRQENGSDNLLTDAELADPNISQAVYPYCNGDANFNVYGQYQYDVQQEGAASTRTRWAWYVQSSIHDPYHVKILSRQTETYKGLERSAYFATMQPEGYPEVVNMLVWPNISGVMSTDYMVLGTEHNYQLVTSYEVTAKKDANNNGIIDENETEVTSKRYVVDSFEQYWKTYDLIRRNLLKDKTDANPADPADVPDEPSFVTGFTSNRDYLTTDTEHKGMGWHAYSKMAKAKRWNGYNKEGAASKGWESREHWFQTVKMGSGYFDLIPVEIAPALILLDQHGWEIMRKPLPTGPDDPNKEHKYDVLRRYDSPMVKEYFFWASAKKRSGYHQYYCLDKRIGGDFTSTSLTSLPPYDSENVKDNKGNQYDQYVTYTVKDEYAQSYQPGATPTAVPFLIRQGNKLAVKATSGTTIGKTFVDGTPGVAKYIMDKSSSTGLINELWYVKPNVNIDREMGYPATPPDWKSNPNAYEETTYSTLRTADLVVNTAAYQSLLTDDEKKAFITKYGYFSFSNGFDPYNIQISSQYGSQYFTMAMTGSYVEEGEIKGDYSGDGGSKNITQAAPNTSSVVGNSYDNSKFAMTNQTFMAVQDADGNMQLMPRFDHNLRVRDFRELVTTDAESADPEKLFETQTQLYRPFVYNYRIIDNEGREALRYKWAGELMPQTPEHLKSPLAKDFKYYNYATYNDLTKKYSILESTDDETSPYEITAMSSMAGAGMSATGTNSNFVYVRYAYNEEADHDHVLLGKWLTMQLNGMDALYTTVSSSGGIYSPLGGYSLTAADVETDMNNQAKRLTETGDYYFRIDPVAPSTAYTYKKVNVTVAYNGSTDATYTTSEATSTDWCNAKPLTSDALQDSKQWQWKFLKNPYTAPDPYAVQLFNRSQTVTTEGVKVGLPMSANTIGASASASSSNAYQHFALLSHTDGSGNADGYALAVARTGLDAYPFLNGRSMSTVGAKMEEDKDYADDNSESGFTSTSGTFHANDSRIVLTDDVTFDITYHVYTNDDAVTPIHSGKYGVEAISEEQLYYEIAENEFVATLPENIRSPLLPQDWFLYYETIADMGDSNKEIKYLYGLYDNHVFVRYKLYDPGHTSYKVPNARNDVSAPQVARDPLTSNDSSLGLDGKLPYNIIWYDDNMMKSNDDGSSVGGDANQPLQHVGKYEWRFEGDDPYAIKIKSVGASAVNAPKYINASNALTADAQTFMLLPKDGYEYGVLAVTGNRNSMLSLTNSTNSSPALELTDIPQRFIIFTLATLRVVYHLVIANIKQADADGYETIAWRDPGTRGTTHTWLDNEMGYDTPYNESTNTKDIKGTSMRDLSNPDVRLGVSETYNSETLHYCYDVGRISLGDTLRVPDVFYRPNVVYSFFVRDICDGTTLNTTLNDHYKGMEITSKRMGLDLDLIGKTIYINIVYSFNGNLDSNSGDNFVLGLNENKWYTLETVVDNKTYLAQYTNAWGFELKEGRGSHYTNDFLWSPIGDPYGFQFFNRYMDVNSGDHNLGEKNRVIFSRHFFNNFTSPDPVENVGYMDEHDGGQQILMGNYKDDGKDDKKLVVVGKTTGPINPYPTSTVATNSIYELLDAKTPGYFRIHPVANYQPTDSVFFHPVEADDDGDGTKNFLIRLSKNDDTEFTFGLSKELLKPYFDRAGYVGGLKKSVYDELVKNDYNPTVNIGGIVQENGYYNLAKTMLDADAVASAAQLRTAQTLVYNSNNIVPFTTGYYRLHSPLGISGIDPARYASGYTHKTELTSENPMHFYEKNSDEVRQFTDFKDGGFTPSPATQGDITIPPVERDPASIFYFEKTTDYPSGTSFTDDEKARYNLGYVGTEGLRVKGTVVKGTRERFKNSVGEDCAYDDPDPNKYPVRAKAVMTSEALPANAQSPTADSPTPLFVMDLGGGVLLIHDNYTTGGRQILKYLSYDYSNDEKCNENTIYDLKLTNYTHTDHAKWCMQPVQSAAKKGVNEMGLRFTTSDYTLNNGGDGYYYTTFYAPFDVLLTDASKDVAYISEVWDTEMLHLRKVGRYNKVTNGLPEKYKKYEGCNQFVPAGTPVIIRSSNTSVTMALPTTEPSTALAEYYKKSKADGGAGNIFSGVCLEQILTHGADYVYVFGLPFENPTKVTKDGAFETNGKFTVEYPTSADTGVGFYINVNYNRETGGSAGEWIRNNKCVLSNKIYIRPPKSSSSRQETRSVDFIPVVFDDDDVEDEPIEDSMRQRPHDNRVYDMLGRCVATPQEVAEGTWRNKLAPGIYILNGRKIRR